MGYKAAVTLKLIGMCRITTLLIFLCTSHFLWATGGDEYEAPRDTSSAVVVYNAETKFLPSISYTTDDYSLWIDSLLSLDTVPLALVNQLNVYRMLSRQSKEQLTAVIDSIFEADNIPQTVVNAVNLYSSAFFEYLQKPTGFAAYVPYGNTPYPAESFYEDWNTLIPNPERNNLAHFDSTLKLLLVDTAQNCGFNPPFKGVVTSHFGWRFGRNHNGIDIDLEVWDPVRSAFPGVVRVARYYKGYGRVVVVRHYNGLKHSMHTCTASKLSPAISLKPATFWAWVGVPEILPEVTCILKCASRAYLLNHPR